MGQRAGALVAPGRAVLRIGDDLLALRRRAALCAEPVAELHALALKPGVFAFAMLSGDHVDKPMLGDEA